LSTDAILQMIRDKGFETDGLSYGGPNHWWFSEQGGGTFLVFQEGSQLYMVDPGGHERIRLDAPAAV